MTHFEAPKTDDWAPVLDKLIVGMSHHISNRVSALAGVSDILAGDPTVPPVLRALADEVPKLEEGIRLLRLLSAPDEPEEAIQATRVVDDALALVRLHPDLKAVTFLTVDGDKDVSPVVARQAALTHAVLIALAGVASSDGVAIVTVRFVEDGDDLVIVVGDREVRARTLAAARR